jgi:hypothetical protein
MPKNPYDIKMPSIDEMLYGKKSKKSLKKKQSKPTKKEFKLTTATRRLITKELGKCENCNHKKSLEVHHIKKVSEGGGHIPSNLIVLCHECHKEKAHRGSLSVTEQRKKIRKRSNKLSKGIKVILERARKRQQQSSKNKSKKPTTKKPVRKRKSKSQFDIDFKPRNLRF